jgi:hypothetical protein
MTIIAEDRKLPLSQEAARALTEKIRATATELCRLLLEAWERKAWKPLGYSSWSAYVNAELDISRQHSYRLLDQGRVVRAIEGAVSPSGDTLTKVTVTEPEARDVKPHLDEVVEAVSTRTKTGEDPNEVVAEEVANWRLGPVSKEEWQRKQWANEVYNLTNAVDVLQFMLRDHLSLIVDHEMFEDEAQSIYLTEDPLRALVEDLDRIIAKRRNDG